MGEKYRFFDSIEGEDERFYTADEFAEYFRQFIRNGIFNGGENLKVVTDEKDMKISIKPGYAWIEGYLYKIAGEDLILEHGIADPSLNRIDRVVIRLDKTLENRYVKAFILEGTPESTPKAPSLTRNDNVYEISLAQVEIIAGKSFIESYQITDERLDNTVCGIATHLFEQVDTTDIFNEWQNYLIHKRNQSDLSYEEFVTAYQNIWNSWIEEKISEPSGEFYAEWKSWFNELQDITNLVTKSQFDEHKEEIATETILGHIKLSDIPLPPLVTVENDGIMSKEDKIKLDNFLLQEAYKDLFNAGQVVPWCGIGSYQVHQNSESSYQVRVPYVEGSTTYGGICTSSKIDLTDWKYLHFNGGGGGSSIGSDYKFYISSNMSATFSDAGAVLEIASGGNLGQKDIYIGNIQGSYYIKVIGKSYKSSGYSGEAYPRVTTRTYLSNVNL